tara:strand:- start:12522 stop:15218 length:2697 start_codon:yes stop_codon:yes gene_type:complete
MIQKELKDTLKLLSPSGSIVSLDIETTGLSPDKDMIIEIGATKLNIEEETYEYFSELINPGIDISEFITDLTGIRTEDVKHSPAVDELKKEFTNFYSNEKGQQHLIIAHNANFDIEFLKKNGFLFNGVIIDTYDLVFVLLDKAEYNLQALSNRFNINVENFHRAKDDSSATLSIFIELLKIQANSGVINTKFKNININEENGIKFAPKYLSDCIKESKLSTLNHKSSLKKNIKKSLKQNIEFPKNCENFFSLGGIGKYIKNYEKRPNQIQIAQFIERNLIKSKINLVEATPGTGKTLGYLVPIVIDILKNKSKAVIATNTIALQDQIINKDWGLIKNYLEDSGNLDSVKISILKGRKNYVCKEILTEYEPVNFSEARVLFKLIKWTEYTKSGDVSEVDLKNDHYVFSKFSSANESCIKKCNKCYIDTARKEAEKSNILLINHSLAMSTSFTDRSLLKDSDYLVIDEAHELLNVATDSFTKRVNLNTILNLNKAINSYIKKIDSKDLNEDRILVNFIDKINNLILKLDDLNELVINSIDNTRSYGKLIYDDNFVNSSIEITDIYNFLKEISSEKLFENIYSKYQNNNIYKNITNSIKLFEDEIIKLISILSLEDINMVTWFEIKNQDNFEIISAPISVKDELKETIFQDQDSVLLTGATLTSFNSPEEFCNQIGIDYLDEYRIFDSEFDYQRNVLFYVPKDMPEPNDDLYTNNLSELVINIAEKNKGKILVLFTSYSSLNSVRKRLKESQIRNKIISQGVDGRAARVISKFKNEGSILLATGPVWQGIDFGFDVEIKVLVISKLPFSVPNDPLINARSMKYIDPFNEFLVPDAVRRFKQGIGRLIRSNKDFGSIVCADSRIINKNYGESFLNCLPGYSYNEDLIRESGDYIKNWIDSHE